MTTDDEAVAAALTLLEQAASWHDYDDRRIANAASLIRALSARVALLDAVVAESIDRREKLEAAEAKLREIAILSNETNSESAVPRVYLGKIHALAHTATQPEATPGKGEG